MKKIVIAGGTGFLGLSLANFLKEKGFTPILMARHQPQDTIDYQFVSWDAVTVGDWKTVLVGAHAVVNLVGKTVDCVKTPDNRDLILRSRVDATKAIGKALRQVSQPPKIWIQMSTAHIYGDPPHHVCTEEATFGYGLATEVGKAWEQAFTQFLPEDTRGIRLRTSFVIGRDGGAFPVLKKIVRSGAGGKIATGEQGMSWIHEYDMNAIIYQSIINDKYEGIYNVTAPEPVSNYVFMKTLRKQMKVWIGLPATTWMVKLGAKFLGTDPELVLYGRYVIPERLQQQGFEFKFPTIEGAFQDLLKP